MSEEEIIDIIENEILDFVIGDYCVEICKEDESGPCEDYECRYTQAINGLLDLYNKEKEKNLCIEILRKDMPEDTEFLIMTKQAFENNPACEYIKKETIVNKIEELKKDMLRNGETIDILYDILFLLKEKADE